MNSRLIIAGTLLALATALPAAASEITGTLSAGAGSSLSGTVATSSGGTLSGTVSPSAGTLSGTVSGGGSTGGGGGSSSGGGGGGGGSTPLTFGPNLAAATPGVPNTGAGGAATENLLLFAISLALLGGGSYQLYRMGRSQ